MGGVEGGWGGGRDKEVKKEEKEEEERWGWGEEEIQLKFILGILSRSGAWVSWHVTHKEVSSIFGFGANNSCNIQSKENDIYGLC